MRRPTDDRPGWRSGRGAILFGCAALLAAACTGADPASSTTRPDGASTSSTAPVTVPSSTSTTLPPDRPPNVVVVVLDDLGVGDLSSYGGTLVATPNIDAIAAGGVLFHNAYANGSVCSPTRAALLTGRHPSEFGIRRSVLGVSTRGLPPGVGTIPSVLRERGYATGHFGKWHLGWSHPDQRPLALGYDEAILVTIPADYRSPVFLENGIDRVVTGGHLTEATVDLAIDFVRRHADSPFFVNLWLNAPHVPLHPPEEWAARFPDTASGRYAALVADADEEIGRLMDALDAVGVADETIVVVTSDNGADFPRWGSTGDYRGEKTNVLEGGIRVPMIVRWPGTTPPATTSEDLVMTWDLLPTFAEAAGADVSSLPLEGRSILPALRGRPLEAISRPIVWESRFTEFAVRVGDWKLVVAQTWPATKPMLFDLSDDPYEERDLAAEHPEIVEDLLAAYLDWRIATGRVDTRYDGATVPIDGGNPVHIADERLDIHDGDFTFRIVADLDAPDRGVSVIAAKWGTWSLELTSDRRVVLRIVDDRGIERELRSEPLGDGPHTVAFTVIGSRFTGATASLFVDDRRVGIRGDLAKIAPGRSRITLGADPSGGRVADGTLSGLAIYRSALDATELSALTSRGV